MERTMKRLVVLFVLAVVGIGYMSAETLTIKIEKTKPGNGILRVGVYNNEDSYENNGEVYTGSLVEVTEKSTVVVFSDLPKDIYAVAVYQDANGNNSLDTSSYGIPTEDYGVSKNTMIPSWKKNSFSVNTDMTITIKLR
jgi:uncharacterized protein (DUF2141 family)